MTVDGDILVTFMEEVGDPTEEVATNAVCRELVENGSMWYSVKGSR